MDITSIISVSDKLGTTTAQGILALMLVLALTAFVWAIRLAIAEIKACGVERTQLAIKVLEGQQQSTIALTNNTVTLANTTKILEAVLSSLQNKHYP